jgi:hypothetical protein
MQAIDAAINLYRRPNLVRAERRKALPENTLSLIRIASGGDIAPEFLTTDRAKSVEEARDASVFYIQQVLLSPKSDEYRQLGLTDQATSQQITEHKRYMLKWLHPDRNPNKWESALFQRVVNAAAKLENHSVAAVITSNRKAKIDSLSSIRLKPNRKLSRNHTQTQTRKTSVLRWLRKRIVLGLALFIVLLIAWRIYVGRWFDWYEAQIFLNLPVSIAGCIHLSQEI